MALLILHTGCMANNDDPRDLLTHWRVMHPWPQAAVEALTEAAALLPQDSEHLDDQAAELWEAKCAAVLRARDALAAATVRLAVEGNLAQGRSQRNVARHLRTSHMRIRDWVDAAWDDESESNDPAPR